MDNIKKLNCITLIFLLLFGAITDAQPQDKKDERKAYQKAIRQRAENIVEALNIDDPGKAEKVRKMVAKQYFDLNDIQNKRDNQLNSIKSGSVNAKEKANRIKRKASEEISKLHTRYISSLSFELSAEQVEKVKDGMTYNVVPLTYANYLLMLPHLKEGQKDTIKSLLVEAREYAMDGGSSKEKHAWFGKYKGKITNYLASQGFDLKKEGDNWAKRRKTDSDALEITESTRVMKSLDINDKAKKEYVRNLLAHQYQQLQEIQLERDAKMQAAMQSALNKEEGDKKAAEVWANYRTVLDNQRKAFIETLSTFISTDQVELVKNTMTDNRLHQEYTHFQALLPNLTEPQKKQVYEYLLEARNNAMNVLNETDRLKWFIKYRGRANNYLSKQGYNLRKATEELETRQTLGKQ